jgi:MFS family permease
VSVFASLNHKQKEAIGLLQIGTFLEYFDFMLYVHMAILLNELFFPQTDPHTATILSAFAFCSSYFLRPFGALIFGWIGDHLGRKHTVVITSMMMSISCIVIANLPTYAQVGITAAWGVTICRVMQGLSSMGEMMGAEVYLTELIKKPSSQYVAVSSIGISAIVGGMVALGVAVLVTKFGLNWRIAFWIGATVAVIGSIARNRLRETPDFLDTQQKLKNVEVNHSKNSSIIRLEKRNIRKKLNKMSSEKKALFAYFLVYCGWPLSFYLSYMYFNPLLKGKFGYSGEDIILHNFCLSIVMVISVIFWVGLSRKFHPLIILKERAKVLLVLTCFLPFLIESVSSNLHIFLIQSLLLIFSMVAEPAPSIFIKHFPVLKRLTTASFIYAFSRAVVYVITSFGLIFITELFGYYGILAVKLPIIFGFMWGVNYFGKLEKIHYEVPDNLIWWKKFTFRKAAYKQAPST